MGSIHAFAFHAGSITDTKNFLLKVFLQVTKVKVFTMRSDIFAHMQVKKALCCHVRPLACPHVLSLQSLNRSGPNLEG